MASGRDVIFRSLNLGEHLLKVPLTIFQAMPLAEQPVVCKLHGRTTRICKMSRSRYPPLGFFYISAPVFLYVLWVFIT